jgi:hypothetical protein
MRKHSWLSRTLFALILAALALTLPPGALAAPDGYDPDDFSAIKATIAANPSLGAYSDQEIADGMNGRITWSETAGVRYVTRLNLGWLSLKTFDAAKPLAGLSKLEFLDLAVNGLTNLDVSGLTALEELICYQNRLASLNVSGLTALEKLDCELNSLTSLDASGLTALEELDCQNNQLASLNVSGLTALDRFDFNNNPRLIEGNLNLNERTLTLTANITGPSDWQWQRYEAETWTDIPGAAGAIYTKTAATEADAGEYRVKFITVPSRTIWVPSSSITVTADGDPASSIS